MFLDVMRECNVCRYLTLSYVILSPYQTALYLILSLVLTNYYFVFLYILMMMMIDLAHAFFCSHSILTNTTN